MNRTLPSTLASGALAAVLGLGAPAAHASPVTYNFAGSGDWASDARPASFIGSFSYDSAATDGIGNGVTAAYAHPGGGSWGLTLSIDGGTAFTLNGSFNVLVSNNLGGMDRIGLLASDGGSQSVDLDLQDFAQSLLGNVSLDALNAGLDAAAFDWMSLLYEDGNDSLQGLLSVLNCVSGCGGTPGGDPEPGEGGGAGSGGGVPQTVPEPTSAALVLSALAAAALHRRRKAPQQDRLPDRQTGRPAKA